MLELALVADHGQFYRCPEVLGNINRDELGNLGLTLQEELDIVAFLKTLTDGSKPE